MTNEEFIQSILEYAKISQQKYGIFVSVTISQACFESGYGKATTNCVQIDNNLFGIKFYGQHDPTLNITQGGKVGDGDGYYCHYESIEDSCLDHGYFLKNNPRYTEHGVFDAKDGKSQLQCIMNAGYAENEYYTGACWIIDHYNLTQYDNVEPSENKVENAVKWAIDIANDNTHGYDQENRWSPDYDCSSFVISAYQQAGIPLKTNGATYTGNIKSVALDTGFTLVDWGGDIANLKRGDIVLKEEHHVVLYIGNGQIVQASINENGETVGGESGDQTGTEIYVRDFYTYSGGWDYVLRYDDGDTPTPPPSGDGEIYKKLLETSYNIKKLNDEELAIVKSLSIGDNVRLKYTFDKRKKVVGINYLGKKLTFDDKKYIIVDVRKNGNIILVTSSGSKCYKYINPKYIMKG